jgi:hypothetical protein
LATRVRHQKQWFVATPIVLGGIAGIGALKDVIPDYIFA